jgi:hypothetical protein
MVYKNMILCIIINPNPNPEYQKHAMNTNI